MSTTHNLLQGTPAWDQFRLRHFGASEAAAMLGLSPNVRRSELLHAKHTGNPKEFSDWVREHVLDHGHAVEALARPIVENIVVGDDLYPVTRSLGRISASCDGLTLDETIAFEHKQWNADLAEQVRAGVVPDNHMPQCQQVLMVTGAQKLIFVVSDGTPERMVYTWVMPDPAWFDRIRAGWQQFEQDLLDYVPPEPEAPAPVGHAPERLPALRIEISGGVTASNLEEFKATAISAIRSIKTELVTDEDFADGELAVKWCADVEARVAAAKEHALSQTASIDALFKAMDEISEEARRVRLSHSKLLEKRRIARKDEILLAARKAYDTFVAELKAETEGLWINLTLPDFAGAAKNKRSFATMQDAVDTCLANGKIEASATAKRIRDNLAAINADKDHLFLFADKALLVHKPLDDVQLVVSTRIAAHKAAEEQKARDAAQTQAFAPAAADVSNTQAARDVRTIFEDGVPTTTYSLGGAAAAPAPGERGTVTAGEIARRLGFALTVEFVSDRLGVKPTHSDRRSAFWTEQQVRIIGMKLSVHVLRSLAQQRQQEQEAVPA